MPPKKATTYRARSSEEMKLLGEEFAAEAFHAERRGASGARALVVALTGELGAGKTTFVQGFLWGAGVRRRAPSPTFVIMRRYTVPRSRTAHRRAPAFARAYHMDAYRLNGAAPLAALGFGETLRDPKNVVLIEWGERLGAAVPRDAVRISFRYGRREGERTVVIRRPASYV